jgi:hypothetical protein
MNSTRPTTRGITGYLWLIIITILLYYFTR